MTPTPARRARRTAGAVVAAVLVGGLGSLSAAYTAVTSNPGNSLATGTVAISDNDGANVAMYQETNLGPGDSLTRCITVTYAGSIPSLVRLYATNPISNGDRFTIRVERGSTTAAFPSCTGFTPETGPAAFPTADLSTFAATHHSYANGITGNADNVPWNKSEMVSYRFTLAAKDDPTPNGNTTPRYSGTHSFTWEARS